MDKVMILYFLSLFTPAIYAQQPNYLYQKEPASKGDTLITDYFPNLRHVFILPHGFYSHWLQDTLRSKKDSTLFSGVICIHTYTTPYEDKVIPASTQFLTYNNGILLSESTEEYCYSAYYDDKDSVIFYGVQDRCFGPYQIEVPDSISDRRIHRLKSWDSINGYTCTTITKTPVYQYYRGQQPNISSSLTEHSTTLVKLVFYRGAGALELEIEKSDSSVLDIRSDKVLFVGNNKHLISESDFLQLNDGVTEKFSVFLLSPEESNQLGYDFLIYHIGQFNPFHEKSLEKILREASTSHVH